MILPNGESKSCTLHSVLYVPKLSYNLISVSRVSEKGKIVKFTKSACRAGAQKVYLCKKGHNYGPDFLVLSTSIIIKKCCCRVWGVALYLKSLN